MQSTFKERHILSLISLLSFHSLFFFLFFPSSIFLLSFCCRETDFSLLLSTCNADDRKLEERCSKKYHISTPASLSVITQERLCDVWEMWGGVIDPFLFSLFFDWGLRFVVSLSCPKAWLIKLERRSGFELSFTLLLDWERRNPKV